MEPNLRKFPLLSRYIGGLPDGLASYPNSTTRSNFSLILRPRLAQYLSDAELPDDIIKTLGTPWAPNSWIPEVAYVALCEIARDRLWTTDEQFHRGMLDVAVEMYRGPFLKTLFAMLGPSIVAMSAAKRWNTLHQGSTMTIKKQHKEGADLLLTYPPKIFSERGMNSLGAAFCGAVEVSRGKNSAFTITSFTETQTEMSITWNYWSAT